MSVYVGNRRVDGKKQDYEPHGTVNPKDAKPGQIFEVEATASTLLGTYHTIPNVCVIP